MSVVTSHSVLHLAAPIVQSCSQDTYVSTLISRILSCNAKSAQISFAERAGPLSIVFSGWTVPPNFRMNKPNYNPGVTVPTTYMHMYSIELRNQDIEVRPWEDEH